MKNVLLLMESLTCPSLHKYVCDKQYSFIILKNSRQVAEASGLMEEYNRVLEELRDGNRFTTCESSTLTEYLLNHKTEKIILSPVLHFENVVSTLVETGRRRGVFICSKDVNNPSIFSLEPQVQRARVKNTVGTSMLDFSTYYTPSDCKPGDIVHFSINNTQYKLIVPDTGCAGVQSGREGITFVSKEIKDFRVKIFRIKKNATDINKLQAICEYAKTHNNPDIALPVSLVLTETNKICGYVMRNFPGEVIHLRNLYRHPAKIRICKNILKQMLWLEIHSFRHRDIHHNIISDQGGNAHIIDIDSGGFSKFPFSAFSLDEKSINGTPACFNNHSLFRSAISDYYTGIMFCIAAVVEQDPTNILSRWTENGFCELDKKILSQIKKKSPALAELVVKAYVKAEPPGIIDLINTMDRIGMTKLERAYSSIVDATLPTIKNRIFKDTEIRRTANRPVREKIYTKPVEHPVKKFPRNVKKKLFLSPKNTHKQPTKHFFTADRITGLLNHLPSRLKAYLINTYNASTVLVDMSRDERWKSFCEQKLYKKRIPDLAATAVCGVGLLMLLL